jgi:hypothetical protein
VCGITVPKYILFDASPYEYRKVFPKIEERSNGELIDYGIS